MSLTVLQPGILSLLQDSGRYGVHRIGLTTGGPLDRAAFDSGNRLLDNAAGATGVEISFGGFVAESAVDTFICVTGAPMPLCINDEEKPLWQVHRIAPGDRISLGFATEGCRAYLGVADGFNVTPMFGSTATVVREQVGGLDGRSLHAQACLPCAAVHSRKRLCLPVEHQPGYPTEITIRVIPGYQHENFSALQLSRFYNQCYTVSARCDRMGYRLEGPAIQCDIEGILSEGICAGAIQIPADGQPIVLLNDRQTIGGYPKLGSALSLDAARMAQLRQGDTVCFTPITEQEAHNALHLADSLARRRPLREIPA